MTELDGNPLGTSAPTRPVVLIVDPSLVHQAPIEAAAALAQVQRSPLQVIVVQSQDYENLASLSFVRELRTSSSQWGTFRAVDVVSGFAGQLRRLHSMVESVASEFGVPWSLTQRAERFGKIAASALPTSRALVIDRAPLVPVNSSRQYQQVIAMFDGNPAPVKAAQMLAALHGALLRVLVINRDKSAFGATKDQVTECLGVPVSIVWQVLSVDDRQAQEQVMGRLVGLLNAAQTLLVLPRDCPACPLPTDLRPLSAATVVLVPELDAQPHSLGR